MAAMALLEDVKLSSGAIENADCLIIIHLLIQEKATLSYRLAV
jgi:hypothetical protein